jgi:hypothetical protein
MIDINEIIGPLQIDSMREVIARENAKLAAQGNAARYKEPRRIVTNVNQPVATTDQAQSVGVPFSVNVARRVAADARDSNPLYRQAPADGGLQEANAMPGNILRGFFGVAASFRFLAQTPAQRLDSIHAGLDSSMLIMKKGDVEEVRFFGFQFLDMGPSAGADGAAAPTSLLLPSVDRRMAPIRPGLTYGKDEVPQIEWKHRRTTAWGAAFELDFYFLCLESRVSA